jgi:transposase
MSPYDSLEIMSLFDIIKIMKEGLITLSQEQLKTYTVINRFIDKSITREQAADFLNLSTRQITRLKKGILASGAESLIHKNTGRKPKHSLSEEMKEDILSIYSRTELLGANFLHFQEILSTDYDIVISYSALSSILKNSGIESPKKKKNSKRTHRRKRKSHPGQLIQIDASPYEWLDGNIKYALHGAIDDATGNLVGLYMTQNECLNGYLETMRQCCMNHGIPQTLYSDKHTIFRSPKTGRLTVDELIDGKTVPLTQFGRSMHELGIDMIFANSAPAKGRIERLWNTLQSRLPIEFAKRGIKTISEANLFLELEFQTLFNDKFSVEPEGTSLFVPLAPQIDLDSILCIKNTRKTDNAGTFSYKNRCFQILDNGFPIINARREITVLMSPRFGIKVEYQGRVYDTVRYIKPDKAIKAQQATPKVIASVEPHLQLRHSSDEWKKIWWDEDYNLSLKFLYELFFDKQQYAS